VCGIIAYIGNRNCYPVLLRGLKRLEYRGYDSAGLSILHRGKIKRHRVLGRVADLEKKVANRHIAGTLGIAHTRWATHGKPSVRNAHPHTDGSSDIHVVHNGIIENYMEYRRYLKAKGHRFSSMTDSEVIAHLIQEYIDLGFEQAVKKALNELEGALGIAVLYRREPNKLIVARRGSPMIIGISDNAFIAASDTQAMNSDVDKVIYMQDNELVVMDQEDYHIMTLEDRPVVRELVPITIQDQEVDKKGFKHHMLKEIFEQPETVENAMMGRLNVGEAVTKLGGLEEVLPRIMSCKRLHIIACGTSYYAGLYGRHIFEKFTNLAVNVELASEFRYKHTHFDEQDIVLAISQSGETADTIGAIREAKRKGALVLGLVNVVGSTIARETHAGVYNHAGPEIGVASTKIFTSQCVILVLMALLIGRHSNLSYGEGSRVIKQLKNLPVKIRMILRENDALRKLAEQYHRYRNFLYIGRLLNYPIALEGALKLKEISYIHAEAYPAGEMKHGPISLIDEQFPTMAIVPEDTSYEKTLSNIEEIRVRNGRVLAIATEGDKLIKKYATDIIYVPVSDEILQPILAVVPLQLFAYHIADIKGRDIDKPRNLAKSVTVE